MPVKNWPAGTSRRVAHIEAPPFKAENIVWFRFSSQWRLSMPLTSGQPSDTSAGG